MQTDKEQKATPFGNGLAQCPYAGRPKEGKNDLPLFDYPIAKGSAEPLDSGENVPRPKEGRY